MNTHSIVLITNAMPPGKSTTPSTYIPGVCNIGSAEIKRRKRAGWTGLAATIILWTVFIWFEVPSAWHLALFFPAIMSATGFLQAYLHFCAYFGFASLFNFGDVGKSDTIEQAEFRAKDRRRAWQIVGLAALIGIITAAMAYLISHYLI